MEAEPQQDEMQKILKQMINKMMEEQEPESDSNDEYQGDQSSQDEEEAIAFAEQANKVFETTLFTDSLINNNLTDIVNSKIMLQESIETLKTVSHNNK